MLRVVTPPAELPVAVAELKQHLRVTSDDEDAALEGFLRAATEAVEGLGLALVTATFEERLGGFPTCGRFPALRTARTPLIAVESIGYWDSAGTQRTLDPAEYEVLPGLHGRVHYMAQLYWPFTYLRPLPVTVRYTAGHGTAADVPEAAKLAVKMLAAHYHEHREAVAEPAVGAGLSEVPMAVRDLLATLARGDYA
jgi:uncharacterized phiE125 gp8 family phage protein